MCQLGLNIINACKNKKARNIYMIRKISSQKTCYTMCVKDCGLQKDPYNNFFACFVGKLDFSHVEI